MYCKQGFRNRAIEFIVEKTGSCIYRKNRALYNEICKIYGITPKEKIRPNKVLHHWANNEKLTKTAFENAIINDAILRQKTRLREYEKKRRYNIGRHLGIPIESRLVLGNAQDGAFYKSPEWRKARYRALRVHGNNCFACGRGPSDGVVIHVDHIEPRFLAPSKCLDVDNLQILCADCNLGKGYADDTDWR